MEQLTFPPVEEIDDTPEIAEYKKLVVAEFENLAETRDLKKLVDKTLRKLKALPPEEKPVTIRLTLGLMGPAVTTQTDVRIVPSLLRDATAEEQAVILARKVELSIGGRPCSLDPGMILNAEVVQEIPDGWMYTSDRGKVLHYFQARRQYNFAPHSPYAPCGMVSYSPIRPSSQGTDHQYCSRCLAKNPID